MNESTRIELFLAKIIGEEVETPEPHTRIELFLAKIAGEDVETPTPITRIELFLAKILGESVETPEPHTRIEIYLAAIAGAEITVPEPETRVEYYLNEWASAPTGEETTVTGVSPLLLESALAKPMVSLTQFGKCSQASTPSGSNVPIVCNNGEIKWDSVNERIYADGTAEVISIGEQTATAESLYAVGDYADTQDIISGAVTRKVGIKVLDGTESWATSGVNAYQFLLTEMLSTNFGAGLCTHFQTISTINDFGIRFGANNSRIYAYVTSEFATLEAWTAFLAAQYAAGTPVIVLYPLAEPVTESVAGQHLSTEQGDNTIYITANVSDIPIEATYMREVS